MADDNDLGDYFKAAAVLAVAIAASSAVNSALQGKQKNATQAYPQDQPIMPVTNFVGDDSKTAGGRAFRDVHSNNYATIQAISEGRLDRFSALYMADDKVTLNINDSVVGVTNGGTTITDGRYQDDDGKIRVKIQTRLGLPTETAYSDIVAAFPGVWDSTCRGDNTGSICVQRFATDTKFQNTIFPAGPVDASVVARGVCYDWRKDSTAGGVGSQRRTDDTTWGWCANPIVWLVHKEWTAWGRDWVTQILPLLADLTTEANYCDTPFALKAGGTQPIYTVAFNYPDDEDYTTTRQRILDAMDGFYCEDGFGRLVLKAGRYEAPDLTFTGDDILESHWEGGELSSDAVDLINISFMSPANDYKVVQCDPWIINEGGTLPTDLNLDGVYRMPQARYLAKRKAARLMPNYRGWIKVGRKGRQALKKRYIRVQNPRRPSMGDVVCEIIGIEYEPSDRSFTINLISADVNIDTWNPATEEGDAVDAVPGVDPGILDAPTIDTITPFYDGINIRLRVVGDYPDRDDITPVTSWRVAGGVWDDRTNDDYVDNGGGSLTTESSVVTPDASLEVRIAYLTSKGALSDWSATETVNSSVVPPTWAAPGALWDMETTATSNRFWIGDTEFATYAAAVAASKASLTRSGSKLAANTSGVYSSFATNVIAMTNKGASLEPSSTNMTGNSDTLSNAAYTATGTAKTAGQTTPFGADGALLTNSGTSVHSLAIPSLT
ncbi:MAG TPA: hypothetical protein VLZ84_04135, partial [Asticcacaulis sp.]|nr:hypothetical protein [Asticcacaulis sp.]